MVSLGAPLVLTALLPPPACRKPAVGLLPMFWPSPHRSNACVTADAVQVSLEWGDRSRERLGVLLGVSANAIAVQQPERHQLDSTHATN